MFVNKEQLYIAFDSIAWEDKGGGIRRKVMAYGDQLMGVYVEFQPDSVGALHSHPHVQFTYIRAGRFRVTIGSEERVLGADDFYYIPSGVVHGAVALEAGVLVDVFTPMREDFLPVSPAAS
jgi:quercetin dioxygenase-like cupin family protein